MLSPNYLKISEMQLPFLPRENKLSRIILSEQKITNPDMNEARLSSEDKTIGPTPTQMGLQLLGVLKVGAICT